VRAGESMPVDESMAAFSSGATTEAPKVVCSLAAIVCECEGEGVSVVIMGKLSWSSNRVVAGRGWELVRANGWSMDGRRTGRVERKAVYVKDERQANAGQAVEAVSATATAAGVDVRQAGLDVASRR
jgi:hypothetical protein